MVRSRSSTVASTSRWRRASGIESTPCSGPPDVDGHGGDEVREVADALGLQRRRLAFEHDRAVDGAGHARGEQAGGVQLALAGGDQAPALEEVEVVLHHGGQPHQGARP